MKLDITEEIMAKFSGSFTIASNGCWIWTKSRDNSGYGRLFAQKGSEKAHRLSWRIHHGDIPQGMIICHKCDTPACVNPDHLFVGTWKDNMVDRDRKLRHFHGSDVNTSKLSEDQVREIHQRYKDGFGNLSALGREYGVSHSMICMIVTGQSWKHLNLPPLEKIHYAGGDWRQRPGAKRN